MIRLTDHHTLTSEMRQARLRSGRTLIQVAEHIGVKAPQAVAQLLDGSRDVRLSTAIKLADALGYDLALIPRGPNVAPAQCAKCGNTLSTCTDCSKPAQCGEPWCATHSPDGDWSQPDRKADEA
jgi:transcriptional regulator with XRE-family HTH domain